MSELKYNEPAERFAPIVEKSLYAGATAVMVPSETGCWVHYVEYCERIANIRSEADKVIAHNKYKRCLAMAKICEDKLGTVVKPGWWNKWHKRWLELAEEPTWAKFLQLIRKEAK